MANDFSGDGSCKALWRFEAGGLTTDSKSTNTLTNNGATEETTNHMEGSCAAALASASSQYLSIVDGSLVSGFPLKSGDTTKIGTIAFWFRPATLPGSGVYMGLVTKWDYTGSNISLSILLTNSKFRVACAFTSGQTYNPYDYLTLTAGRKYHATVSIDGVNKLLYVWIYDNTAGVLYSYVTAMTNVLRVVNADFAIGCEKGTAASNFFNGVIDEVVVLNRMVNEIEAVKLRSGTYSAENKLDVLAVHAYVEYQEESKVKISQVIAEVEWMPTDPNTHLYSGTIPLSITPQGTCDPVWEYAGSAPIAITFGPGLAYYQAPGQFEYHSNGIILSVLPDSATAQGYYYRSSGVPLSITPQADIFCPDRFYDSPGVEISITPMGVYSQPVPGWDIPSGYGLVDFTDLGDPPPFWCIDTDGIFITLNNLAPKFELYAEYSWEAAGGAELAGACTFAVVDPDVDDYTTMGGVKVDGSFNIQVPEPWITTFATKGGALVQGGLEPIFITPSTRLITEITTEGGVVIGGTPTHTSVDPSVLVTTVNLQGGAVVGGYRYPPFEFVDPDTDEVYYEFTARGTVYVGGNLEFDIPEAPAYEFSSRRGGAQVGGDCTFGFWQPPVTEFDLLGGVFIEGSIVEDIELYETYTLTGQGFQPSIYSGFNFNSYAERNGQVLAARSDGIYVLEGADDAGQKIRPGVRLGPTNFGVDNLKGVRAIYPGDCGPDAAARVFCPTKGQEGFYALDRGRFSVGYEILDRLLVIEITDFEQLSHLEILPRMRTKGQG
jgi:hypothetical protein